MSHKKSSLGRKSKLLSVNYIQGWAGYIQRDGGSGLAMLPFCLFGLSVIADFMAKWHCLESIKKSLVISPCCGLGPLSSLAL